MVLLSAFYTVYFILLISKSIAKTNTNIAEMSVGTQIFFLVLAVLIFFFSANSLFINAMVRPAHQIIKLRRQKKAPKAKKSQK